ncbi:MAG: hypothetical protein JW751_32510 [Polyangiaceae bacterium]|nr:hypothetical protein [Polyangiaceae bacterium]
MTLTLVGSHPEGRSRTRHRPRARVFVAFAVSTVLGTAGCGRGVEVKPASPRGAVTALVPVPLLSPPRVFALPGVGATPAIVDRDGTERYLLQGLRVTRHPNGALERARDIFPKGNIAVVELPERIGRGYLFHTRSSGDSLLWRSTAWTGPLRPLARLGFDAEAVHAGFDRLYVVARGAREAVALDPITGKVLDLGSLPTTMGVRNLAFADAWLGLADVPYRGALVTFDAGASWHPLGLGTVNSATVGEAGILVRTSGGSFSVDPHGRVVRMAGPTEGSGEEPESDSRARVRRAPSLRDVVIRGWPDTRDTAIVLVGGALVRVRLRDGATLDRASDAVDRGELCQAVALGAGFGFVCTSDQRGTVVYRYQAPLSLDQLVSFSAPRFVAAGGTGALAIRGPCAKEASHTADGDYCIMGMDGSLRELRVSGDHGVERVVALRDGRVAVLVPPRFGDPGQVAFVVPDGTTEKVSLRLPRLKDARRALLRRGLWLDGFRETHDGKLAGWVAGANHFVGVRIGSNGRVWPGELAEDLDRSTIAGAFAISLHQSGRLRETTNGGFAWRDADPVLDLDPLVQSHQGDQGCSSLGCAIGDWVRVGWQGPKGKPDRLGEAETPPGAVFPPSEGGRWLMRCSVVGTRNPPALNQTPIRRPRVTSPRGASRATLTADTVETTDWQPFEGMPAPTLGPNDVGFDAEVSFVSSDLHAYAWGPRGGDWLRNGTFVVRGSDSFATTGSTWSTAPTPAPWPDVVTAAQVFGQNVHGNPNPEFAVVLDPGGRGGVVSASAPSGREFYVVEAGRAIQRIRESAALGVGVAAGAVKVGGSFYLGADRETFRVYRVASDHVTVVGDYPKSDGSSSANTTWLVRNARGDALGLWVRAVRMRSAHTSWYVFPIDIATGAIDAPLAIEPRDLGRVPAPCEVGDDGWVLVGPPPTPPYIDLDGVDTSWPIRRVDARILASPTGLCLDALAADATSPPVTGSTAPPTHRTVSMSARDEQQPGRQTLLRCGG